MLHENWLLPEGYPTGEAAYTLPQLQAALDGEQVLRAQVLRCDSRRQLTVRLGGFTGYIPPGEAVAPFLSGAQRDIAVLSCVGRQVCCVPTGLRTAPNGDTELLLSRRRAQEKAMDVLEQRLQPGDILRAQVTHLAPFGAFVDVGCGLISLLPLATISVSRSHHSAQRFARGQHIRVRLLRLDREQRRLYLSHRELLGSWLENAADFRVGDTVPGIVRGSTDHGVFVELRPNLVGLANRPATPPPEGEAVSVYIRSIQPQSHKLKLQLVQQLGPAAFPTPLRYYVTGDHLESWSYYAADAQ